MTADTMDMTNSGSAGAGKRPDPDKHTLSLRVFAPRAAEPKLFEWSKNMKVGDAASEAAAAFGYTGTATPKLQLDDESGRVLDSQKPLVAEHLKDGDSLTLIAEGGGV